MQFIFLSLALTVSVFSFAQTKVIRVAINQPIGCPEPLNVSKTGLVKVFPNPLEDTFTLLSPNLKGTLEMVDTQGRKVRVVSVQNSSTEVDVSELPAGVYVIRLIHNVGIETLKVKIQ